MNSGMRHDGRAPDYDDWKLNGDLILWYNPSKSDGDLLDGIRVNEESLLKQIKELGCEGRLTLDYHRALLNGSFRRRLGRNRAIAAVYVFPQKAHIGEVQASVWPEEMIEECQQAGIKLL